MRVSRRAHHRCYIGETMPDLLTAVLALTLGLVAGYLLARRNQGASEVEAREAQMAAELAARDAQAAVELATRDALAARDTQHRDGLAEVERALAAAEARLVEQQKAHEQAEARSAAAFRELAGKALQENATQFLQLAKTRFEASEKQGEHDLETRQKAIEQLVKPLQEKLADMGKVTRELEARREKAYGEIQQQFTALSAATGELHKSSHALGEALKGSSQARGRWGEMALRNVVELAGMTEHCDFSEQFTDAEGQRPDMVVSLPGGGAIPIDAKTPFSDYAKACETSDSAEREAHLAAHAAAVRLRVKDLARKDYARVLDAEVDFTVMFIPADPMLAAAFQHNPELQTDALRDRVLIATPVTLVALLRTVGVYWNQEKLARNADEVVQVAGALYERLSLFGEHLGKVGKGLNSAVAGYNKALGSFQRRVLPSCRKLEELGAVPDSKRQVEQPPEVDSSAGQLELGI